MQPGMAEGFVDQGQLRPENLIAGEFPLVTEYVTITGGTELNAGAVMGQQLADGLYRWSDAAATDGSQIPEAILAVNVDTQEGDVRAPVYKTGEFNRLALVLGPGHTLESITTNLRLRSIFLKANLSA